MSLRVVESTQHLKTGGFDGDELERIWKESTVASSTYSSKSSLAILSKTTTNLWPKDIRTCVHSSLNLSKNAFYLSDT